MENDDEYSYFSYIKKSDFRKLCNDRVNEIQQYANSGFKYENKSHQLDYAMRSYYWGMTLCMAHPQGSTITIKVDRKKHDAYSWFEERINSILASLVFSVNEENPGEINDNIISVNLNITSPYNEPISNLKIRYHNGQRNTYTLFTEGRSLIKLYDPDITTFDIRIECDFEDNAPPQIKNIMESIDKVSFKSNVRREINIAPYLEKFSRPSQSDSDTNISNKDFGDDYLSIMKEVEKGLRSKNYSDIERFFTPEGYGMLDTLSGYGNFSVVGQQEYTFIEHKDIIICRGIVMNFEFKNSPSFINEVVFRFDKQTNLISSIAFRLSSIAENDIHSKPQWPLENRLTLVNFLEDYQTAYALKRYDFLESIFSDDALIIVGHVLKKNDKPLADAPMLNLPFKQIELITSDKKTYFKNLSRVFAAQEYIHIRFAETDFSRQMSTEDEENPRKYEDIYGVRLLQEYNSFSYSDKGYLFLMVDLRKEVPIIHVRAWQPDKVDIKDVIGLKDLR